jgi:methylphosphotriester-DNA--protein-cysteine methyltransferase
MIYHANISDEALRKLIKQKTILFGGNQALKIYGLLRCRSGKRMKRKNRVFFSSRAEAIMLGFRPCGHCLNAEYKRWKNGPVH